MTAVVAAGRRVLPRGWTHFGLQIAIWIGFYFSYQAVRSLADRDPTKAFVNGFRVIDFEQRLTSHFLEQTAQRDRRLVAPAAHGGRVDVLELRVHGDRPVAPLDLPPPPRALRPLPEHGPAREHDRARRLRRSCRPRRRGCSRRYGFVDGVNHSSHVIGALANPYAAMPSLHAADALIVGVFLFRASRHWWSKALWALWPAWVWFCVLATANHFWLDVLAGIVVALLSLVARRAGREAPGTAASRLCPSQTCYSRPIAGLRSSSATRHPACTR